MKHSVIIRAVAVMMVGGCLLYSGCKKEAAGPASRTYRMGFQNSAPRYNDVNLVIQVLNTWTPFSDVAMITAEVPWDSLLAGKNPVAYVKNNYSGLVDYYRQKNLKLWVYVDPENGLNRAVDSHGLTSAGHSITEAAMQKIYRRFVVAMDSLLKPEHLGLALETNLIRQLAPDSIYQGVKKAAQAAFNDVRLIDSSVKISISVQAETAWGQLGGTGTYVGINQDFIDFPFLQELGISSYPYFSHASPQELPLEYYSKLVTGHSVPVFVSEGGWSSETFAGPNGTISSSPELQQQYIARQSQLLDQAKAIALFQLTFTDIDLALLPGSTDPNIKYFAYLGMLDVNLNPRPAFSTWKGIFARPLN